MFFAILSAILIILLIKFVRKTYAYWENFDVPHLQASIPFGNLGAVIRNERSFGTAIYDIYRNSKDYILGIYLFFRPALLVRDAALIKNILTTDFEYFHDRGVYVDAKRDPMSANLFSMEGEEWKGLRTRLTPAFTSGKLRGMFENIKSVGTHLVEFLQSHAENQTDIEIRDIATRYVADSLALIAFGQDGISSIDNTDHEFRMNALQYNANKNILDIIRRSATFICPNLLKILHVNGFPKYINKFCLDMVTKTIQHRESNNIVRKDLMQYLIQLRNSNDALDDWKIKKTAKDAKSLSYENIASNVFLFYIAGFESSSSTIAYTLYELTKNEKLMERAKNDIRETLEKHDGKITYESIMEMKFIDLCVKETMRKYPALPILNRECTKDYKVPDTDFTIQKGTPVIISLLGVSRDEKYFPNPEKYDPDRFLEGQKNMFEAMYMPFGAGPRNCIAFRMGLLIVKIAVVMLLQNFKFEALSYEELEFDIGSVTLLPIKGKCVIKILKNE